MEGSKVEKIHEFRLRLKNRWDDKTIESYTKWVARFLDSGLDETDPNVLYLWDDYLYDKGMSYNTRLIALSAVKLYQRFVVGINKSDLPEVHEVIRGEPPAFKPKYVDIKTVNQIFEEPWEVEGRDYEIALQHATMIKLGYNLILRAEELVHIRKEDIDLKEGTVFVHAAKGSMSRRIYIDDLTRFGIKDDPSTLECLRELASMRSNYLFLTYGKVRPWSSASWRAQFLQQYGRKYGTNWHAFARHSPIIHRLEAGEPFEDVWLRARHKNPTMTARYAALVGRRPPRFMQDAREL